MGDVDAEQRDGSSQMSEVWTPQLLRLFDEERLKLVRLAYLMVGSQAVAEEIVQDAFLATATSVAEIKAPRAYVRTAVVNRCHSWGRHQKVVEEHRLLSAPEPVVLEADELWDALAVLPERRRLAIVLRFYEDLPHDEIGTILGCSPITVRTAIHRGLKQLKREIGHD